MTPLDGVLAWVEAWRDGWARHDPEVIAARYASDCRFRSQPFRRLERGREAVLAYANQSFGEERSARFTFAEPIVGADERAAVEYRAVIIAADGTALTIHGVSLLVVGADGLITEHRDTWTELEGDHGIDLVKEDAR
jgi:nuclear transport factor 2 (NTF2) superfamily protein